MSTTWSKGPICGVDNCRSQLYRSLDGFKFCQYGHVRQGDVEINDEEDDALVTTRRMRLPSQRHQQSQRAKEERSYGLQARVIFFECFQYLLQKQCEVVIEEFAISNADELKQMVKLNWVKYLKLNNMKRKEFDYVSLPQLVDAPVIIYLSCYSLQLPVYIIDIHEMINDNKMIYMTATTSIPTSMKDQLPSNYMRALTPRLLPLSGDLYKRLSKMHRTFGIKASLNYAGLVLKIVRKLILPLDMCNIVYNLVELLKVGLTIDYNLGREAVTSPEINITAVVVIALQVFFYQQPDLLLKWFNIFNKVPNNDFDEEDVRELVNWDEAKITNYLDKISKFVLNGDDTNISIGKKRVFDIFQPALPATTTEINYYDFYNDEVEILKTIDLKDLETFLIGRLASMIFCTSLQLETVYKRLMKTFQ